MSVCNQDIQQAVGAVYGLVNMVTHAMLSSHCWHPAEVHARDKRKLLAVTASQHSSSKAASKIYIGQTMPLLDKFIKHTTAEIQAARIPRQLVSQNNLRGQFLQKWSLLLENVNSHQTKLTVNCQDREHAASVCLILMSATRCLTLHAET